MRDRLPQACLVLLALCAAAPAFAEDDPRENTAIEETAAAPIAAVEAPSPVVPAASALTDRMTFDLNGYYRTRFVGLANVPVGRVDRQGFLASEPHVGRDDASGGSFFYSRLRLEPSLRFGGDPATGKPPRAAIYSQIDLLDTVLWGDNARRAAVPLFAGNPSQTGIDGLERPDLLLRRLWLELALPVGMLRVGRQGSHGGMGILFNDGNGFRNDFGDADHGTTFDRILFATRPLTIFNAITRGDRRETPLIWIVGYDRLVQDTLGFGSNPSSPETRLDRGPYGWLTRPTCGDANDPGGSTQTRKCDNAVGQFVTGLIWRDEALNLKQSTDELMVGAIYVNRGQGFTDSGLHIFDVFWRFQMGFAATGPALLTEGEVATIRGSTNGIKLLPGGFFDEDTGLSDTALRGDILNYAARVGLTTREWDGLVEIGHSSGDEQLIGDPTFRMYPMHSDYKMGLLMYPVAAAARSYNTNAGRASDALHGGGGVFNSTYLNAKGRYRIHGQTSQVEVIGQGIFGWADTLNGGRVLGFTADYYAPRDPANPWANNQCRAFEPACAIGMEFDLAVRFKWLPTTNLQGAGRYDQYRLHWSNEFGVMRAGRALAPRLAEGASTLWTAQSRIAFLW